MHFSDYFLIIVFVGYTYYLEGRPKNAKLQVLPTHLIEEYPSIDRIYETIFGVYLLVIAALLRFKSIFLWAR